jgi:hypothetical protein
LLLKKNKGRVLVLSGRAASGKLTTLRLAVATLLKAIKRISDTQRIYFSMKYFCKRTHVFII